MLHVLINNNLLLLKYWINNKFIIDEFENKLLIVYITF